MYDKLVNIINKRSQELSCTIIVPMILGNFYGANYSGRSFVSNKGTVLSEIGSLPDILVCEV